MKTTRKKLEKKAVAVAVELPTGTVRMESPVSLQGMLYTDCSPGRQHLLFVPKHNGGPNGENKGEPNGEHNGEYNGEHNGEYNGEYNGEHKGEHKGMKFQGAFYLKAHPDGTVEAVRKRRPSSKGERLANTEHGTFTKQCNDIYLVQFSLPCEEGTKTLHNVILNESQQIADIIKSML